nr:ATP-binding protein [uncultured Carboxylicivirga sp.]
MKLDNRIQDSSLDQNELNDKIIKKVFLVLTILVVPVIIIAVIRSYLISQELSTVGLTGLLFVISLSFLFYSKWDIQLRIHMFLIVLILLAGFGMYHYGFFALSKYALVLVPVFSILYLSYKRTILFGLIASLVYMTFGVLYVFNIIPYSIDTNAIASLTTTWVTDGLVLFILAISISIVVYDMVGAYKNEVLKLQASEDMLYNSLNDLPLPVGIINKNYEILFLNNTLIETMGYTYSDGEDVSSILKMAIPDEEEFKNIITEWKIGIDLAFKTKVNPPIKEYAYQCKDGTKRVSEIHYSLSNDKILLMFVDQTDKKERMKEIVNAIVQTEEKERGRIAKELHDGLGPLISTAKIYAHSLTKVKDGETAANYNDRLQQILDESINEIKGISNNLSPHVLRNYGLKDAVLNFVEKLRPVSAIDFTIDINIQSKLNEVIQSTIYRSLVELINNSIKYANAKAVVIRILEEKSKLMVVFNDNGVGFDLEKQKHKGFGLNNLVTRINNIGGNFDYHTEPGKGVNIKINLPL